MQHKFVILDRAQHQKLIYKLLEILHITTSTDSYTIIQFTCDILHTVITTDTYTIHSLLIIKVQFYKAQVLAHRDYSKHAHAHTHTHTGIHTHEYIDYTWQVYCFGIRNEVRSE